MLRRGLLHLAIIGLLSACDDSSSGGEPEAEQTTAASDSGAATETHEPEAKSSQQTTADHHEGDGSQYAYSPVGKRDPFRSYLEELAKTPEVAPQRRVTETEMFELDQYRLTAIITGTAQPRAMVEDPNNIGHTIRVGSRLGRHAGEITKISSHGIVVVEEARDATGQRIRVTKRIDLPQTEFDLSAAKLQ